MEKMKCRGKYIKRILEELCLSGDAYVYEEKLFQKCRDEMDRLSYTTFKTDLAEQLRAGFLYREGTRIYSGKTRRYEEFVAEELASTLQRNIGRNISVPEELQVGTLILDEEQRKAVELALNHRISIILGGAGSGKTTLIRAIAKQAGGDTVLAAPTGKAARNLTQRTRIEARTVHSALGMIPDDDFLTPVSWRYVDLVIVDEASMMTLEMLAGFLCKMSKTCRLVLLGDPNQLLSVGSGNVLPDLLKLGVPHIYLEKNYRQADSQSGLKQNVVEFSKIHTVDDLTFDESFLIKEMEEEKIREALVEEAVRRYECGESMQVLSPYNKITELSAAELNRYIRARVNPPAPEKREIRMERKYLRDGDRVIITKNDRERRCNNGDVGTFRVVSDDPENPVYYVALDDGRAPLWGDYEGMGCIALAYAITVHKSQGGEFDSILMAVSNRSMNMMYRNLIYTAISRARKQVVLFGYKDALNEAVQKPARPRLSMLVTKTHQKMYQCA